MGGSRSDTEMKSWTGHDRYEKIRSEFSRALDNALSPSVFEPLSLSLSRSCSLSYTLSTPPARFFMAWIASGVSSHTQKAWSFHVARRVALSYRRSHNSLFYLISSLVDRLPLDHFRHQGFTTVMATRKKPGWHRQPNVVKEAKDRYRENASAIFAGLLNGFSEQRIVENARIVLHLLSSKLSRLSIIFYFSDHCWQ